MKTLEQKLFHAYQNGYRGVGDDRKHLAQEYAKSIRAYLPSTQMQQSHPAKADESCGASGNETW